MKASLIALLFLGAAGFSLAGCEAANVQASNQAETRNVYVAGNGADRNVQIPVDQANGSSEAPYAIRGNQSSNPNLAANGMLQGTNSR